MGFSKNISPELALLIVAILSLPLAMFINWAIYALAYFHRPIGPWYPIPEVDSSKKSPKVEKKTSNTPRPWIHFVPILGWLFMARESRVHGSGIWIRPFLIELLFPIGMVMLYAFEMNGGLLPEMLRASKPSEAFLAVFDGQVIPDSNTAIGTPLGTMHIQFFSHTLLIVLMMVATFIDFDERLIPDWITTPGTLLALIGSAMFPHWHLLFEQIGVNGSFLELLQPASPSTWNSRWSGDTGLWIGLACYSGWCFALADRRLIIRRGFRKAVVYFCAGLVRHWTWKILLGMWLGGLVMIVVAHQALSPPAWQSLFSSLVGMALGGAVVWAVRIVASLAMRVEALGFGDVTLMAMVGAFIGWQPTWLAFFLAPIVAICFVLIIWIITRDPATPFGPYLCAGTLLTLLFWDALFNQWAAGLFALGSTLIMILLGFLLLLGFVLWVWYQIKQRIFR